MPEQQFAADIRHMNGATVLDLHGEINGAAEGQLSSAYDAATIGDPATILFNFRDVDYINSTGIALIVGLLARARASKRQLLACGLSDHYVEIFAMTRLADFMAVYSDEASALAAGQGAVPA